MSQPKERYKVCAGRPYGNDGKKQWIRVGELTVWSDGGMSIRLDAAPVGNWFDGNLKCFPPAEEQRGERQQPQRQGRNPNAGSSVAPMAQQQTGGMNDDDIPF